VSESGIPSAFFTSRLTAAFDYARTLHASQVRKGTTIPYLAHLLAVTALVIEHGGDEDQAMAALLHDAIEDQGRDGRTRSEIEAKFGDRVARIVTGCTDADTVPKPPWRERKQAYLAQLAGAPVEVRRASAADKLHNARAILADYRLLGEHLRQRFNATREEQLWYYRSLVTAFRQANAEGELAGLVDELDEVVRELEREVQGRRTTP
jgi:(p)ppGpp synthase/HD superfamily hydrolase